MTEVLRYLVRAASYKNYEWEVHDLALFHFQECARDYAQTMQRRHNRIHGKEKAPPRRWHVIDLHHRACIHTLSTACEPDDVTAFVNGLDSFMRTMEKFMAVSIELSAPLTQKEKAAC